MGKYGHVTVTNNGHVGSFVDFFSFHWVVVGGTLFESNWVSTDRHREINGRFKSCLLNARSRRGTDIGLGRNRRLMVTACCVLHFW